MMFDVYSGLGQMPILAYFRYPTENKHLANEIPDQKGPGMIHSSITHPNSWVIYIYLPPLPRASFCCWTLLIFVYLIFFAMAAVDDEKASYPLPSTNPVPPPPPQSRVHPAIYVM